MGVLTSGQFFKKQENAGIAYPTNKSVVTKKLPTKDVLYRFKFDAAPRGESDAFTAFEDKDIRLALVDGIFTIPKDWSTIKKDLYVKMFHKMGWRDVSERITSKPVEKKKDLVYFVGHPDNSETERVNGNLTIVIGKKELQLECKDGMITTSNKRIYQALLRQGFYELKAPRVKESDE